MAIPSNPSVTDIVTDALRHVLTSTPTSGQITELTNNGFQTVKTEIWYACKTERLLSTSAAIVLTQGSGNVTLPSDFDHVLTADVYTCSDSMTWTAAAGAAGTITAPSTFSADVSSLRGLYCFTLSGTGSGQYRQITSYDNSSKVVSIAPNWTTPPDNTTVAFIGTDWMRLVEFDPAIQWPSILYTASGRPRRYRLAGTTSLTSSLPTMEISPVPDKTQYAMVLTYGPNLTRLDEAGSLFVKHLRERRALWVQGLICQAARRYDEARYPIERQLFQQLLHQQQGMNTQYSQMSFER